MIKTLRLRNFKAFEDTGDIELKPITVIAGPNSGGKSSILQSLLLLKQTLEAPSEVAISLDGKFLQFSGFSDMTFGKPPLPACNVSFSFGLETPTRSRIISRYLPALKLPNTSEEVILGTRIELSFRARRRSGKNAVVLDHFEVSSEVQGREGLRVTGTRSNNQFGYKTSISSNNLELQDSLEGTKIETIGLRHFIPNFLDFTEQRERDTRAHTGSLALNRTIKRPLRDFENELEENLEYLGPLRERPQRAYLHSGNPMTEIGESGQYAAQILWLERNDRVEYLPEPGEEVQEVTLMEAVNYAFQRLGLLQSVDVRAQEAIVYQILLPFSGPRTRKSVTIADVGFGVSQLLPILVLGLRSSGASLLLLEQPEIHLHPKLQANLADFLLALALQGKRILVETHSDHFINRLRRRIAEDPNDKLKDIVNILFVHPPQDGQGATIQPLKINQYGIIENWPQDFLPEAADEAQAIFGAGLRKRGVL